MKLEKSQGSKDISGSKVIYKLYLRKLITKLLKLIQVAIKINKF